MKTLNPIRLASVFLITLIFSSCDKNERIPEQDLKPASEFSAELIGTIMTPVEDVAFCSSKSVSLCAGQNIAMGAVMVQTTIGDLTYITYKIDPAWSLREVQLYVGPISGLPVNNSGNPQIGQFPYRKTFSPPFTVKEYTFILSNLPKEFTVAAHASVVKVSNAQSETAWGEGCNGERINKSGGGSWGTLFNYSTTSCDAAKMPEPEGLCSSPITYFFEPNDNGVTVTWKDVNEAADGVVSVGGYNYTEAEGRAIYTTGMKGLASCCPGGKKGVVLLSTLKLSYTDYASYYQLNTNVAVVEKWLASQAKVSPTNVPACTSEVNTALEFIKDWIDTHPCPGR